MAIIICPECSSSISDQAFSCPKCGYPILKNANQTSPSTSSQPTPVKKSKRKAISWFLFAFLFIIFVLVYNNNKSLINGWLFNGSYRNHADNGPAFFATEHTMNLTQGSIIINAGYYRHIDFSTTPGSYNNVVSGRFKASRGYGSDIRVIVMTQDDYTNFVNGHSSNCYYDSGKKTVSDLNVTLPSGSGSYTLVFDNTFSVVTDKEVETNIQLNSTY
jgi:hypothetical protein